MCIAAGSGGPAIPLGVARGSKQTLWNAGHRGGKGLVGVKKIQLRNSERPHRGCLGTYGFVNPREIETRLTFSGVCSVHYFGAGWDKVDGVGRMSSWKLTCAFALRVHTQAYESPTVGVVVFGRL